MNHLASHRARLLVVLFLLQIGSLAAEQAPTGTRSRIAVSTDSPVNGFGPAVSCMDALVEQPIVRVNGLLRGVYLASGTHTVVWRYRPASLRWGAAITLCALAGSLLLLRLVRRSRRKAP